MNKSFQNKAFSFGFWIGIILFSVLNFLSVVKAEAARTGKIVFADGFTTYGFPLPIYVYGGYPTVYEFVWIGIILNIFIAVIISFVIGLFFKFIWSKITLCRVKLK